MSLQEMVRESELADVAEKVERGLRLSVGDGMRLLASRDLLALGAMAHRARLKRHGRRAYYCVNRHLNPTNICVNRCRFCAFSRSADDPDAYLLSLDQIMERAEQTFSDDVAEFHIVGGLHPEAPFSYYLQMLRRLRERYPGVCLQAFTAVEIAHLAKRAGLSVRAALRELQEAGLSALPGGGAEVFSPRVRRALCPDKLSGDDWLEVMRTAHELGIKSNATMLYGHIETPLEAAEHLARIRAVQDETGGFLAFIPLAFHPQHTALEGEVAPETAGIADLRAVAAARLMLDNVPHIKVFWIMTGVKLAQVALSFGADDLDGTVIEEQITHSAGASTPQSLTTSELEALITEAGFKPFRRNTLYQRA
jgi:aminodeoxyfutalosine synthase